MFKLINLIVLVAVVGLAVLYFNYETLDPCRMLAQEMANDTLGDIAERPLRMLTSQYTTGECVEGLWERWTDFSD